MLKYLLNTTVSLGTFNRHSISCKDSCIQRIDARLENDEIESAGKNKQSFEFQSSNNNKSGNLWRTNETPSIPIC